MTTNNNIKAIIASSDSASGDLAKKILEVVAVEATDHWDFREGVVNARYALMVAAALAARKGDDKRRKVLVAAEGRLRDGHAEALGQGGFINKWILPAGRRREEADSKEYSMRAKIARLSVQETEKKENRQLAGLAEAVGEGFAAVGGAEGLKALLVRSAMAGAARASAIAAPAPAPAPAFAPVAAPAPAPAPAKKAKP